MEILAEYFAELERRIAREVNSEEGRPSLAALAVVLAAMTGMLSDALWAIILEAYKRGVIEFQAIHPDSGNNPVSDSEIEDAVGTAARLSAGLIDETTLKDLGNTLRAADEQEGGLREMLVLLFVGYRQERGPIIAEYERQKARSAGKLAVAEVRERLTGRKMRKRNVDLGDGKVCATCKANTAAGSIPLRHPFPSGDQHNPFHPRCRCWLAFESVT